MHKEPKPLTATDRDAVAGKTYVLLGASSGLGRGVALKLATAGVNLVLGARRTEVLNEVARAATEAGSEVAVVTTDISQPRDVQYLAEEATRQFGTVDVWINFVGVGAIGAFWDIPIEDHARLIDVNLKGVIFGSHAALRLFRSQGYGTLINLGSIDSELPLAYQGSYSASKAGVLSLGRVLNEELRLADLSDTIKVSTVMPWAVDTPWWGHAANYSGGTPRMGMMDDPDPVVDAIIRTSIDPREEKSIGWKAKASDISHHLMPDATEIFSANLAQKYQIEEAPPSPHTTGAIYEPMRSGQGIDDGVRERMKREDAARKAQRTAH
jgi:short-subunit dehydrogenase